MKYIVWLLLASLVVLNFGSVKNFGAKIIEAGSRDEKKVVLTFDADMTPGMLAKLKSGKVKSYYDQQIIDTLKQESVPATIFITGLWATAYPDAVKDIGANSLFEIGNHSYTHGAFEKPCYGLFPVKDKTKEIADTQAILTKLTGKTPKYFRFPGGCFNDSDVALVESMGLKAVAWDVVSGDAFSSDEYHISKRIQDGVQNGSIIVMHLSGGPNAPATSSVLPSVIHDLKAKGFTFVPLSALIGQ